MKKYNNEYVIVRGDRSGIFAGNIVSRDGKEVKLENCRRLWYWSGANSISQLAVDGTERPNDCKFTLTVNEIEILDAIEIIPCTEKAEKSIKEVEEWKR
jgi:hypothetical protein